MQCECGERAEWTDYGQLGPICTPCLDSCLNEFEGDPFNGSITFNNAGTMILLAHDGEILQFIYEVNHA